MQYHLLCEREMLKKNKNMKSKSFKVKKQFFFCFFNPNAEIKSTMTIWRQNLLNSSFLEKILVHNMRLKLFCKLLFLEFEFDKLQFQAVCSNIE